MLEPPPITSMALHQLVTITILRLGAHETIALAGTAPSVDNVIYSVPLVHCALKFCHIFTLLIDVLCLMYVQFSIGQRYTSHEFFFAALPQLLNIISQSHVCEAQSGRRPQEGAGNAGEGGHQVSPKVCDPARYLLAHSLKHMLYDCNARNGKGTQVSVSSRSQRAGLRLLSESLYGRRPNPAVTPPRAAAAHSKLAVALRRSDSEAK